MSKLKYSIGDNIFYYNKWSNEIENGEIINIRQSNLNWDYKIRYQIYNDMFYIHWIEEDYLSKSKQILYKFLK